MAFESLSEKIGGVFKGLKIKASLQKATLKPLREKCDLHF